MIVSDRTNMEAMIAQPSIESEAAARLADGPLSSLRKVVCSYCAGILSLTGSVHSYYHKQVAQILVSGINGVQRIDNQLVVRR